MDLYVHGHRDVFQKYDDTQRIQSGIDTVANKGGGIVHLQNGSLFSGLLKLRSLIELRIEKDCTLLSPPVCKQQRKRLKKLSRLPMHGLHYASKAGYGCYRKSTR